ncbi:sushi, von Willebrand factor type A, EGF and pentraxin domain-containing protein 1-like [Saccostrea cucullata]|uniref:sushi, von Willebrand factor type A, EGF and pentraxin domain-containing protein 1-like n=1 Tax=Saccostrea cuccullata TaxID=36930 RepID=UPI002ED00157
MNDGNVSEAAGVTFNSHAFTHQTICGTVFAFNDQEIRLWSMSDYVACADDGWGAESFSGDTASLYIQAWILDSCNKHFSTQFTLDKSDTNTVERVSLDSVYSLDSAFVSVLMKVSSPNNDGFIFHAGGSAMIDTSNDTYGAIIYGYNETEVLLWRPSQTNTNGHLVYVGGEWGDGQSNQESDFVEVIVKVIDITDCPIPPDIFNAYKLYDGVTNGSKALYACKTGFTESSDDVMIKCIEGTWSNSAMFCKVVCPSPPTVENAAVFVQDNRAKYFCLTGYFTLKNTVDVIECRNSIWPSTDFKCIKYCPDPPNIANADVMVSKNVALYSCREGFLPKSGNNTTNCLLYEWQKTNFTCYASSCGPVPNITNADFLLDNDVAMYACRYGYRPTNADNKITRMSGKWTHTSLQCQDTTKGLRSYITNETLAEWIQQMKKNLSVHKLNTSAYNRSLISVYESRPSAVQIGSVGVFLISFTIVILILPDIVALVKNLCKKNK